MSFLNFDRAVVTGGAGFIGSQITDRLRREGCQVTVLDDLSTGSKANLPKKLDKPTFRFLKGSILDPAKVKEALRDAERVFHEAAIVSNEYASQNPAETSRVNIQGTLNVLEAARIQDIDHLTFASSAAVYGDIEENPIPETAPTKPISLYGASKLAGELFAQAYYETYGLKATSLRYFNVYGPRQAKNAYSGVITVFLQNLRGKRALEIQGDGEQTRDFIYITDVVEGNLKAASSKEAVGQIFNIATGVPTSINQLASILQSLTKVDVPRRKVRGREGDIRRSVADPRKAGKILDFKAQVSLQEGLESYLDWLGRTRSA